LKHRVTGEDRFYCELEGKYKCRDLMQWFVNRGEDLNDVVPKTFYFYRNITVRRAKFKWEEKLVSSHEDTETGPMYYTIQDCKDHVQLKVDFTSIPKYRFQKKIGLNGEEYYRVGMYSLPSFQIR
jgi:hypothetical protein